MFSVGEYIICQIGDSYVLGRIKSFTGLGAFVAYHEGETGALTSYENMHKINNGYVIKETTLGGICFKDKKGN